MTEATTFRELAIEIWRTEIGKPYRWGGDDPVGGFDCSGLVEEGLEGTGRIPMGPPKRSAAMLAELFRANAMSNVQSFSPGCLLFYNRKKADGTIYIGHVAIVWAILGGQVFTLEAASGGSSTLTEQDAIDQNAYVRVKPAATNWVLCVDPFKGSV